MLVPTVGWSALTLGAASRRDRRRAQGDRRRPARIGGGRFVIEGVGGRESDHGRA